MKQQPDPNLGAQALANTQALAGRSCDTCSVVGCDHEYCLAYSIVIDESRSAILLPTFHSSHGMRNELYLRLKWLHRPVQCARFVLTEILAHPLAVWARVLDTAWSNFVRFGVPRPVV